MATLTNAAYVRALANGPTVAQISEDFIETTLSQNDNSVYAAAADVLRVLAQREDHAERVSIGAGEMSYTVASLLEMAERYDKKADRVDYPAPVLETWYEIVEPDGTITTEEE